MTLDDLLVELPHLVFCMPKISRTSGVCTGCGYEHSCTYRGCALLLEAECYLLEYRKMRERSTK